MSEYQRFAFGENWSRFLSALAPERIALAEESLRRALGDIDRRSFLDIGSGSGLFSLAAARQGASVHSFDYDPRSVACTAELRRKLAPEAPWTVEHGSVLDNGYLNRLGQFDIVYSWGVLHHTGDLWSACTNASLVVTPGGRLFISMYNDQGWRSGYWKRVKRAYCAHPSARLLIIGAHLPYLAARIAARAATGRMSLERGMSPGTTTSTGSADIHSKSRASTRSVTSLKQEALRSKH